MYSDRGKLCYLFVGPVYKKNLQINLKLKLLKAYLHKLLRFPSHINNSISDARIIFIYFRKYLISSNFLS